VRGIGPAKLRGIRAASVLRLQQSGPTLPSSVVRVQFSEQLEAVDDTLARYRRQLEHKLQAGTQIADDQREWETVRKLEAGLEGVRRCHRDADSMLSEAKLDHLEAELESLQALAAELPSHLYRRLSGFADEVRGQYRGLIFGLWTSSLLGAMLLGLWIRLFHRWILVPLRVLLAGSRRVAAGEFRHRIRLDSQDEMAELADAMNGMTARFQAIRDDLDRQVQERTKQVIRNEELASVGFLAAGVAHEINNPLATIALCAESLEGRAAGLLDPANPDHAVFENYLRMIQEEAFRCKEITEKLLDFSRIGPTERHDADLAELARDVVAMLAHLGKYQQKRIEVRAPGPVVARVNAREIKQVILNLLTNALDSIDASGTVWVDAASREGMAELAVTDNGCGMSPDLLDRVFEPFFTRRRVGQGTGLGLSIAHRIVADHGGEITAQSDGPDHGATFRVRLPLLVGNREETDKETSHRHYAA